jgi:hypothetical protein
VRQEDGTEDETRQAAEEENYQESRCTDGFFQSAAENEEKDHIAEKVQHVGMNKQRRNQRPGSAIFEIAQSKNEISFGERRLLLPGPEARRDASEYQQ